VLFALQEAREEFYLGETLKINTTNCLGPCRAGAILAVYPEGVWYGGVTAADVSELVISHFLEGKPVERLRLPE
jgi:(2Fe-2S) ferredoxin